MASLFSNLHLDVCGPVLQNQQGGCFPCRHITLLRAVVREDLSLSMADELVKDIARAVEWRAPEPAALPGLSILHCRSLGS